MKTQSHRSGEREETGDLKCTEQICCEGYPIRKLRRSPEGFQWWCTRCGRLVGQTLKEKKLHKATTPQADDLSVEAAIKAIKQAYESRKDGATKTNL